VGVHALMMNCHAERCAYCRQGTSKNLPLDEAVELWRVLLTPIQSPLLAGLCEYFKAQKLKQVGKDLWMQSLVFLTQTRIDFSNYNEVHTVTPAHSLLEHCHVLSQQSLILCYNCCCACYTSACRGACAERCDHMLSAVLLELCDHTRIT
jgi:Cullin binding